MKASNFLITMLGFVLAGTTTDPFSLKWLVVMAGCSLAHIGGGTVEKR